MCFSVIDPSTNANACEIHIMGGWRRQLMTKNVVVIQSTSRGSPPRSPEVRFFRRFFLFKAIMARGYEKLPPPSLARKTWRLTYNVFLPER